MLFVYATSTLNFNFKVKMVIESLTKFGVVGKVLGVREGRSSAASYEVIDSVGNFKLSRGEMEVFKKRGTNL
jgi:hypothetical protein